MELRHIRYFVVVAEECNLTRAAKRLMIAQPPLSRQIKDLEEELGTQLFVRKSKGLELTEAGHHFLSYATRILQLSEQSVEDLHNMEDGLQGTLYLATVEGMAPRFLSEQIKKFHARFPKVEFNLWNGNTDDVCHRVHNGLCDIAIITAPFDEESLEGVSVGKEPWIAMIPKDHPLAALKGEYIDLVKLAPYELLIPSRISRLNEIQEWFKPYGSKPKVIGRLAHMINAYELTRAGVGIAIYPEAAASYGASDEIVVKKLKNPRVMAEYILIHSRNSELSMVAREFWSMVIEEE